MKLIEVLNLGCSIQYARLVRNFFLGKGCTVRGEGLLLDALVRTRGVLEKYELASGMIDELSSLIDKLDKNYPKDDMNIKNDDSNSLGQFADKLREEVSTELGNFHVLKIELQSGLNPIELTKVAEKEPSEFISLEIWEKLTEIEKSDFSDAARCLLSGTATPSVMVGLRGAEASVRNYYHVKTGNEPGSKTWRQLTRELKDKAGNLGIEDTFIGYLDYIGDAKRNFAQHPNKIYQLREAVILFMQVIGLVEDIYAQI